MAQRVCMQPRMSVSEAARPSEPPSTPPESGWPLCRRVLLESATALLIGIVLAFLWPKIVGEEFATRGHARLYAPFAGWTYSDAQRDQTTVLLIDNATLTNAGETWPPRYAYHARLVKALARYQPRAVFFDVYFSQVRDDPSLPALINNLCALQRQGTRVFLGVSPDADGDARLRPEIEALQGTCFDKVALQYTPDSLDRLAWSYPLTNEEEHGPDGAALPSAALAIYRQAYGRKLAVEDNEMALTWGLRAAQYGVRWVDPVRKHGAHGSAHGEEHGGEHGGNALYCRRDFGLAELAPVAIKEHFFGEAEKPVCVYHQTLYAGDLASSSEQEEAALKQLLQGKTVMIGTALSGSGDRVLSPVHGRIPGVYLHAMALDNLLAHGQDYARDIHMELSADSGHVRLDVFLVLSLLCGLVFPKAMVALWKGNPQGRLQRYVGDRSARVAAFARPLILFLLGPKEDHHHPATPPRSRWKQVAGWGRHALRLVLELAGIVCKLALAMVAVCVFIWVGQRWFSIGLMTTVDIVFFTFAAEWFELNEKLLKRLGMGKSEE